MTDVETPALSTHKPEKADKQNITFKEIPD